MLSAGGLTISNHWKRVRALGCAITRRPDVQIAHCHGGSMRAVFGSALQHGMGKKTSDWLVIPLHMEFHTGPVGLDTYYEGPAGWEAMLGVTQLELLEWVARETETDVFDLAGLRERYEAWRSLKSNG